MKNSFINFYFMSLCTILCGFFYKRLLSLGFIFIFLFIILLFDPITGHLLSLFLFSLLSFYVTISIRASDHGNSCTYLFVFFHFLFCSLFYDPLIIMFEFLNNVNMLIKLVFAYIILLRSHSLLFNFFSYFCLNEHSSNRKNMHIYLYLFIYMFFYFHRFVFPFIHSFTLFLYLSFYNWTFFK